MTTTQHTPGPWKSELWKYPSSSDPSRREVMTITGESDAIAQLCNLWRPDEEPAETMGESERDANARLIAAAPELLSALQGMMEWARRVKGCNPGPEPAAAHDAIAKATGESIQEARNHFSDLPKIKAA